MNQSLTLAFLIAAGIGLVVQNTLMVRITQTSSTILIAMLLNSLVGILISADTGEDKKRSQQARYKCPPAHAGHQFAKPCHTLFKP